MQDKYHHEIEGKSRDAIMAINQAGCAFRFEDRLNDIVTNDTSLNGIFENLKGVKLIFEGNSCLPFEEFVLGRNNSVSFKMQGTLTINGISIPEEIEFDPMPNETNAGDITMQITFDFNPEAFALESLDVPLIDPVKITVLRGYLNVMN